MSFAIELYFDKAADAAVRHIWQAIVDIGVFPTNEGVIFLGVTVTQKLQQIHAGFHAIFAEFTGDLRPYYQVNH